MNIGVYFIGLAACMGGLMLSKDLHEEYDGGPERQMAADLIYTVARLICVMAGLYFIYQIGHIWIKRVYLSDAAIWAIQLNFIRLMIAVIFYVAARVTYTQYDGKVENQATLDVRLFPIMVVGFSMGSFFLLKIAWVTLVSLIA